MNALLINQTENNPFVEITSGGQSLTIKGNSFIRDPRAFYEALLSWAKDFKATPGHRININITPGYYSTSNIQVFNLLFRTLDANNPGQIDIHFYVEKDEEEDMEEIIYSVTFNTELKPVIHYIGAGS